MALILSTWACQGKASKVSPTLSTEELVIAQLKSVYQRQTRNAIIAQTQESQRGLRIPTPDQLPQQPDQFGEPTTFVTQTVADTPDSLLPSPTLQPATLTSANTLFPTGTATLMPTATVTLTPILTLTPTFTSTPNVILTPIFDWSGSWTAYFDLEVGSALSAPLTLTVSGNTITGSETFGNSTMTFTGTLSTDRRIVMCTWSNPPASGYFIWRMLNQNQFVGNTDDAFAYCGSRNGVAMPVPCFSLGEVEE